MTRLRNSSSEITRVFWHPTNERAVGKFRKTESGSLRSSRRRTDLEAKWTDRICPCVSKEQKYSLGQKTENLTKSEDGRVNTEDWDWRWEGGTIVRGKQGERGCLLSETQSFQLVPNKLSNWRLCDCNCSNLWVTCTLRFPCLVL